MGWERSRQHVCKVTCALIYLLSDWMQLSSFPGHCWLAVKLVHYHRSEFWKLEIVLNGNKLLPNLDSAWALSHLWKVSCPKCFPEAAVRTGWDYRGKGVTLFTEASFLPLFQGFPWEEKQMNGNTCTAQPPSDMHFKGSQEPESEEDNFVAWNRLNTFHLPVPQLLLPHLSQHAFSDCHFLLLNHETTTAEVSVSAWPTFGKMAWITTAFKIGVEI